VSVGGEKHTRERERDMDGENEVRIKRHERK
jgi:hypothetical protein